MHVSDNKMFFLCPKSNVDQYYKKMYEYLQYQATILRIYIMIKLWMLVFDQTLKK